MTDVPLLLAGLALALATGRLVARAGHGGFGTFALATLHALAYVALATLAALAGLVAAAGLATFMARNL